MRPQCSSGDSIAHTIYMPTPPLYRFRIAPTTTIIIIITITQAIFCVKLKSIDQIVIDLWCMTNKINSRLSDLWSIFFSSLVGQSIVVGALATVALWSMCRCAMRSNEFWFTGLSAYRPNATIQFFFPSSTWWQSFGPKHASVAERVGSLAGSFAGSFAGLLAQYLSFYATKFILFAWRPTHNVYIQSKHQSRRWLDNGFIYFCRYCLCSLLCSALCYPRV